MHVNTNNIVMWVILPNNAEWDCFKTPILQEILRFKIYLWNIVHFWKSYICAISWMCKNQTSVSHSSTESEIISLDAGLRLDGILALDFLGSDRRSSSRKHELEQSSTGGLMYEPKRGSFNLTQFKNERNLMECRHMSLFKCPLFHLTPIDQV